MRVRRIRRKATMAFRDRRRVRYRRAGLAITVAGATLIVPAATRADDGGDASVEASTEMDASQDQGKPDAIKDAASDPRDADCPDANCVMVIFAPDQRTPAGLCAVSSPGSGSHPDDALPLLVLASAALLRRKSSRQE